MPVLHVWSATTLRQLAHTGLLGVTFTLCAASDAVSLLTAHLALCHHVTASLFQLQLASLSGLFNLFRGKRWNVLRQRTDSYQYEIDQLFLGTVLFTLSIFLMPTTMSYAGLFSALHLALWLVRRAVDGAVKALNAFPLFEVMLRLKEPSRLPGLSSHA